MSMTGIRPLMFSPRAAQQGNPVEAARTTAAGARFNSMRDAALRPFLTADQAWNEAVAALIEQVGNEQTTFAANAAGEDWHEEVANAVRDMTEPLRSDVILSMRTPKLQNAVLKGGVRIFGSTFLEQDLEFMPLPMKYPKFPYFRVEPATQESLFKSGLSLMANPPAIERDEADQTGTCINGDTYLKVPMLSVELDLTQLLPDERAAVLLNWSCKGRGGAHAKLFINGEQDVRAFEVMSTDDDNVPNFWTFVPWKSGKTVVDLKHVGSGYLWFEHVDVHHVRWTQ